MFVIFFLFSLYLIPHLAIAQQATPLDINKSEISIKDLPHQQEVESILKDVDYSGFSLFLNPETNIKLDFENNFWYLQNARQFDSNGNINLYKNRFGLCADLAMYTFNKLRPLLSKKENIKYAMAIHKDFFPTISSNHIVLLLFEKDSEEIFIIDPSFKKYGHVKDFKEYEIQNFKDDLSVYTNKIINDRYKVNTGVPLFIRGDVLITFTVISLEDTFNKDNFMFIISGKLKGDNTGLDLIIFGNQKGKRRLFVNEELIRRFVSEQELELILMKIDLWFKKIVDL